MEDKCLYSAHAHKCKFKTTVYYFIDYAGQMAHSSLYKTMIYIYISLAELKKILDFVINSLNFLSRVRCEKLGMFLVATRMRESNSGRENVVTHCKRKCFSSFITLTLQTWHSRYSGGLI